MLEFHPVTYALRRPMTGTIRAGERSASWTISGIEFDFLRGGQPRPPDSLIFNCLTALLDEQGEVIPVEILSLLDLEGGLRKAFTREHGAAWDAVYAGE